jgi:hypothetical protein
MFVQASYSLQLLNIYYVRGVESLLGLSPLGLISRLLMGQVRPLYIMSRPYSSSLAAHGEEGDCAGKCLQGVCGGAAAGCGAWPPSAPAAAEDVFTYARGDLGGGRPQHRGA